MFPKETFTLLDIGMKVRKVGKKCLSNTEQSKSDEGLGKKAMDCLCKIPKTKSCPQLTVCKDRTTNERLGIHCFQQIVEAVKEDAAATGTFM